MMKDTAQNIPKNKFYIPVNWFASLKHALEGLYLILKNERNFRIQLFLACSAILVGVVAGFSRPDWIAITIVIALVLISEALNSVVEAMCDTISQEYKVNIKYAKDVAAGAVLISSIVSLVAGLIIIYPYIGIFIEKIENLILGA